MLFIINICDVLQTAESRYTDASMVQPFIKSLFTISVPPLQKSYMRLVSLPISSGAISVIATLIRLMSAEKISHGAIGFVSRIIRPIVAAPFLTVKLSVFDSRECLLLIFASLRAGSRKFLYIWYMFSAILRACLRRQCSPCP